jgi:diguanylate cyclase (GGDEF)-like protein/PAS domain S-box-containing protein
MPPQTFSAPLKRLGAWRLYLAAGALVCALYVWVPPFAGSGPVMNALGLSPVLAILAGMRIHRPASRGPWWFFAGGFTLFWLGDLYTYSYPRLFGGDVPFPSIGDGAYVLVYPALMAGLLMLVRRRNPDRDRAGLIDSLIMTLGLSLLSWVALIAPYLHDGSMDTLAKLVSIAYPLGDILLLAAAIRLAVDSGRREPAFYLLALSIVALLVTDFAYGVVTLEGNYDGQVLLDVGWISFYLLWGAAALHPSMVSLERPATDRDPKLTPFRLMLLTGASLIAPAVELFHVLDRADMDLVVIIGASAVLFGLVVLRMAGLVRQQERSVARERTLSGAGAALVAATSREETAVAALDAIRSLAGDDAQALLCLVEDDGVEVVAARTEAADGATRWTLPPATAGALLAAAGADGRPHVALTSEFRGDLRLGGADGRAVVLGLSVRSETRGLLVVAGGAACARAVESGLRSLATQVSLALESAALTEEVHRRTSEARFGALIRASSDLVTVLDADARIVYQSPSIERVLGYTPEDVVGTSFAGLLPQGEQTRLVHLLADAGTHGTGATAVLECALRTRDGGTRQFEIQHTNLLDDEHVRGIVLNSRDVSERKAFEDQLQHQAFHDPVTGLANRALFAERVRHAVARARRDHIGLAVIFIDLDDFKTINDSLGHAAGDQVLLEVGKRLATSIRASDTAARFGGDEFAVLLEGVESAQEAADTAERIQEALAVPLSLEHKELVTRASMGISVVEGESASDAEELIRNADAAMYIAKRDGKGGYRLFEPAMHEGVLARLELRADLQRALASDQFDLYYQPVVRLGDGRPAGVEALLRWRHPERGLVPPDEFIPFAEEIGLIVPIGRWVLREGCRQAVQMQRLVPSDEPLSMAINLSVKQLQHSDIVGDVRDALADSGLDPASLTLEITETVMMTDTELVVTRLKELKQLGVRLAMDDFGTGYSSLSYLSKFPVDVLKMDRSFLRADASPETAGLATAVVSLGETLDLEVVAEGIEQSEQWTTLRDLGCDKGQGFFFARPMTADAALDFLRVAHEPVPAAPEVPSEPPAGDAP